MQRASVYFLTLLIALASPAVAGAGRRASWSHLTRPGLASELPRAPKDKDYRDHGAPSAAKVELGRLLFFDKILSGNQNISCATCHHPLAGTGDGLSLPVGEGGLGLGMTRDNGWGPDAVHERVPRNAPPVFNLGAKEFDVLFWDGRVTVDGDGAFVSPAGADLPTGLDSTLAVQAMFPVTSGAEMAGQPGENPQADAAGAGDLPLVWEIIAEKLRGLPEYVELFRSAFDEVREAEDISYVHAANAIAAFEAQAWRFDNAPFDRFLRGERGALSESQKLGMKLFYGEAGCSGCHSGAFQTDHSFHAIAMPQIGPGKGDGVDGDEDFGRFRETGQIDDLFKFRTPTLRNVALTGPWGHSGAYDSLEAVVRHHLNPPEALDSYDHEQAALMPRPDLDALDFTVMDDPDKVEAIANANELKRRRLSPREFGNLLDFLHALTDPATLDMRHDVPRSVPSGLPLAE